MRVVWDDGSKVTEAELRGIEMRVKSSPSWQFSGTNDAAQLHEDRARLLRLVRELEARLAATAEKGLSPCSS